MNHSEELVSLSSLRFAPVDPITMGPSPTAYATDEVDGTASLPTLRDACQTTLTDLVAAHHAALFHGLGDANRVRDDIVRTMEDLADILAESLYAQRRKVVALLGRREDVDLVTDRLATEITDGDEDEEDDDTRTASGAEQEDGVRLQSLEADIVRMEESLRDLLVRKGRLVLQIREGKRRRDRRAARRDEGERQRRDNDLVRREIVDSLETTRAEIERDEREVEALTDGVGLWREVAAEMIFRETQLARLLRVDRPEWSRDEEAKAQVGTVMESTLDLLDGWLETVKRRGWTLLDVLLTSERETYRLAFAMLQDKVVTAQEPSER